MGAETIIAKGEVLNQLVQMTAPVPFDDDLAQGYLLSDLHSSSLRQFLREVGSEGLSELDDDAEIYRILGLTVPMNAPASGSGPAGHRQSRPGPRSDPTAPGRESPTAADSPVGYVKLLCPRMTPRLDAGEDPTQSIPGMHRLQVRGRGKQETVHDRAGDVILRAQNWVSARRWRMAWHPSAAIRPRGPLGSGRLARRIARWM